MPAKAVVIDGVGTVKIYKRKGAKTIRLSIVGDGTVRITQPRWLPYKAGLEFAHARKKWIIKHQPATKRLQHGQMIGKSYRLSFEKRADVLTPSSRIRGKTISVSVPSAMQEVDDSVQMAALRGVERALKHDAETLLIPRLKFLAQEHGFTYKSVQVKKLKSRWGSCTQHKDIVLSSFLIQLPWPLIDYVILHELQHTEILAHGPRFWSALDRHVVDLKQTRTAIKQFQARVI